MSEIKKDIPYKMLLKSCLYWKKWQEKFKIGGLHEHQNPKIDARTCGRLRTFF